MRSRWVRICVAAAVLLLAGAAGWHWWPRTVAPGLTPQMVKVVESPNQQTITLVGGGSRRDAHTLWSRYHDRPAYGTPAESPRLLGISLAKVESDSAPGSGTFWVVYSDHVWLQPSIGDGAFGREVIYVNPVTLRRDTIIDF